jgi:hypothetical protein
MVQYLNFDDYITELAMGCTVVGSIPSMDKRFFLLSNVLSDHGAHPAYYSVGTGGLFSHG